MLSVRKINAGCGYEYLTRSVAHNDEDQKDTSLADYYAAKGTPPGRWIGSGLPCFGGDITLGDVISSEQMMALFGDGLHPNAIAKSKDGVPLRDLRLGRPFPLFAGDNELLQALKAAERGFVAAHDRLPTVEERSTIARNVGHDEWVRQFGRPPVSDREVIAWVNRERATVRQAVAGYDLTFSPQKSISVLWALSDKDTADRIARAHHQAVARTLQWAEENCLFTRRGAHSIEQIKTKGLIAAEFTHFDTRTGDPDLHSHVVVSNKVQGVDGVWRSVDGRALFQHHHALDFRYTATLNDLLTRELGLTFYAKDMGDGKHPVYELDCVPEEVCALFSTRQKLARPVYEHKLAEFTARRGRGPSYQETKALWQEAILATRDAKQPAHSLDTLRDRWAREVDQSCPKAARIIGRRLGRVRGDGRAVFSAVEHDTVVAKAALDAVVAKRSTFRRSHLVTAVAAKLAGYQFHKAGELDQAIGRITASIIDEVGVLTNPEDTRGLPAALIRADGHAIDYRADQEVFTTQEVLDSEARVLDTVTAPTTVFAATSDIDRALKAHARTHGWALSAEQEALVRHLATVGTVTAVGVGAAGAGKTAAMSVLADVWEKTGRSVHALAPSAAAAEVLGADLGVAGRTIDALTHAWRTHNRNPEALPVAIGRGDMLLVDEASMASHRHLSDLTEIAKATGAVVRLIGDPRQIKAVESGGLFATMTYVAECARLTDVRRFGADHHQAAASLALREGDTRALGFYESRGWIHGGGRDQQISRAVDDYLADLACGRISLIIAATNEDVDRINQAIQAARTQAGAVDLTRTVRLAHGEDAGVGDTIITRKNQWMTTPSSRGRTRVINGDLFRIKRIHADGSVTARHQSTGTYRRLPGDYVAGHTQLGYASTVYRAQGATVDVCRAVVDETVDRSGLYVAATRGRDANHLYTVAEHRLDEAAEDAHYWSKGDKQAPTAREVLSRCLDNDDRSRSATEEILGAAVGDPEQLVARWRAGRDIAVERFIDDHLPAFLEALPGTWAADIAHADGGDSPIRQVWRELLRKNQDPRDVWDVAVRHCDNCRDIQRALTYQLRQEVDGRADNALYIPPTYGGQDTELRAWLKQNILTVRDTIIAGREHHDPRKDCPEYIAARRILDGLFPTTPQPRQATTGSSARGYDNPGQTPTSAPGQEDHPRGQGLGL